MTQYYDIFLDAKVFGHQEQRQTHSNLQLKRRETRRFGCSVKPYEDRKPSTYRTSTGTSNRTQPVLMLLGGEKSVIILEILRSTRIHQEVGYTVSQPGRTTCYECEKQACASCYWSLPPIAVLYSAPESAFSRTAPRTSHTVQEFSPVNGQYLR
jgi:hypothetical protein